MMTKSAKVSPQLARKKSTRKKLMSAVSICPVGGAGWCPYPFSLNQLQKHLKSKSETNISEEKKTLVAVGARSRGK
jgi:hypothetical protein